MTNLAAEDALQLVLSLLKSTQEGELLWREEEERPGRFDATTTRFAFTILDKDQDGVAPFDLIVWRGASAKPTDTVSSTVDPVGVEKEINEALERLWATVRDKVRGLESLVAEVVEDLSQLDEEPF